AISLFVMSYLPFFIILSFSFFFTDAATTPFYTLSLHDALPISVLAIVAATVLRIPLAPVLGASVPFILYFPAVLFAAWYGGFARSEEHTSELQSRFDLVCRLLLEKKNIIYVFNILQNYKHSI